MGRKVKVSELRVVDLRRALESRGLDKTGVKAALIERLAAVIISNLVLKF